MTQDKNSTSEKSSTDSSVKKKAGDEEMPLTAPPIPEYELSSYEPVEFTMPKLEITDNQVKQRMLEFAEKYGANYQPTDRKIVGPKENITIDLEVLKDGEVIPNLSAEARLYTLGEGLMPLEFDRNILGMKVDEEKEFDFNAPDFEDLDNMVERPFHAKVKITQVMEKVTPEITDDWVAQYVPFYKSADDFEAQVRKGLADEAARMVEQEKNARSVHMLSERFDGKIDDYFYEVTRSDLLASYEQQAKGQGMDLEDFIGKQGMDQQQFSMMLMMQVREMLVQGFSLDAWARHYGIEPTKDDIEDLAEMMAPGHGAQLLDKLKEDEKQMDGIRVAARRYVANRDLTEKAIIKDE